MSDQHDERGFGSFVTRREAVTIGLALAAGGTLAAAPARPASASSLRQATPAPAAADQAAAIVELAREVMTKNDLKAVILRVVIDGQEIVTAALGESMTGVPATPALHSFSSERRVGLGIPAGTRFYEEATYWDPSWTVAAGAVQTMDIVDLATTAVAVGEGTILSPQSHAAQIDPGMLGFGTPIAGCAECRTLTEGYNYGIGTVLHGKWILQNPLFGGYAALGAYLPGKKIAIAVATTFGEGSFDDQGNYTNGWNDLFLEIGGLLAPESMPASS